MNTSKKRLVVISGVTGAIGSALFAEYGQDPGTVIYGISRKARPVGDFLREGKLPQKTLICSIGDLDDYSSLFDRIDYGSFNEVIYIHALGLYPFEVNNVGNITVECDRDGDGINDNVTKLTYDAFISATSSLQKNWRGTSKCIIFGSIADKYHPSVHQSWWKTIEKVKGYMNGEVVNNPNLSMVIFNISSVLCPHEVITRPFVFVNTDANQIFWLHPYELARFVVEKTNMVNSGFNEFEKYRIKPGFVEGDYYTDPSFTPRKVMELY